jgi:RNA polymerase sigma factor (sigma-70 family)
LRGKQRLKGSPNYKAGKFLSGSFAKERENGRKKSFSHCNEMRRPSLALFEKLVLRKRSWKPEHHWGMAVKNSRYGFNFLADKITINGSGELAAASHPFRRQDPKTLDLISNRMHDTPEQWDEARLLEESRADNRAAWDEFLRRYGALLWASAKKYARFIPGPDMAEDFFQEICFHILEHAHKWEPSGDFSHYLSVMASRKAIDVLRTIAQPPSRIVSLDDAERPLDIPASSRGIEAQIILQEQQELMEECIEECIEGLPPLKRKLLKDQMAGRDPTESAKEMGITVNHRRVLVHRAKKHLQDCVNRKLKDCDGKKHQSPKTAGEER